jgi:hypothetical protein
MVLLACTGCGLLFRPLFVVAFDEEIEKQRKKMEEEEKQRNLFAVLNRAEDGVCF